MQRRSSHGTSQRAGQRRGFTLIEALAATILTAVLLAALLTVLTGLSSDRQRLARSTAQDPTSPVNQQALADLIRQDLASADTVLSAADGQSIVIHGHGGLAPETFQPNGRLTRVTYRVRSGTGVEPGTGVARSTGNEPGRGGRSILVREQRYLDDPGSPLLWSEIAAVGVRRIVVDAGSGGASPTGDVAIAGATIEPTGVPIPRTVHLRIEFDAGAIDRVLNLR